MKKTILITGASTGIGKEVALYFAKKGWHVAATMRSPEKHSFKHTTIKKYKLDVTDQHSIKDTIQKVIQELGSIDVIVNNAGYGALGIFEKATTEQIQKQFEVNVFGVMNVIRRTLPHFKKKKAGLIINISSMAGLLGIPMYSVYHGSKWALEGFTESLQFELQPFNIQVKNVEPGAIKTDFYTRSQEVFTNESIKGYDTYEAIIKGVIKKTGETAPGPKTVAEVVYKAATDGKNRLRYPVGKKIWSLLLAKKLLPNRVFFFIVKQMMRR